MTGKEFKEKALDYLAEHSTWMAGAAALIVVLSSVKPEWVPVAAGVLSAFGLLVRDKKGK